MWAAEILDRSVLSLFCTSEIFKNSVVFCSTMFVCVLPAARLFFLVIPVICYPLWDRIQHWAKKKAERKMMFAMLAEADVVAKMKAKQMVTFPTHLEWLVYFSSSSILLFFGIASFRLHSLKTILSDLLAQFRLVIWMTIFLKLHFPVEFQFSYQTMA